MNRAVRAHKHAIILPVRALQNQLVDRRVQEICARHRQIRNHHAVRHARFQNQRAREQILNRRQIKLARSRIERYEFAQRRRKLVRLNRIGGNLVRRQRLHPHQCGVQRVGRDFF